MAKPYLSLKDVRVYFDENEQSLRMISKDRRLRGKPFQLNFSTNNPSVRSLYELLGAEGLVGEHPNSRIPQESVELPRLAPENLISDVGPEFNSSLRRDDPRMRFLVGEVAEGTALQIDLGNAPHTLISGDAGTGKTELLRTIVRQVQSHPDAQLWFIGAPNGTRRPLFPVERKGDRLSWGENEAVDLLDDLHRLVETRHEEMRRVGVREWHEVPGFKPIFLVADEIGSFLEGYRKTEIARAEIAQYAIGELARTGRAAGVYLFLAMGSWRVSLIDGMTLANLGRRILFGAAAPEIQNSVLGRVVGYSGYKGNPPGRGVLGVYGEPLRRFQAYDALEN